ncbi:undecaprenyl-diphosphatase [Thermopolyspora flexuosa]|uniref:Undecaprenyl-diphosphatase n=1 Tax=Thermopolyspora flexuosa TaxID=103836 RepID=A0A543IWM1_9ACTN|nr:undecaprenyl-diphosphatase [Thermopolyspora flexuosa]
MTSHRPRPRPVAAPPGPPARPPARRRAVAVWAGCVALPLAAAAVLGLLARTPAWTAADARLAAAVHELRAPLLTAVADALRVAFLPPAVIAVCAAAVLLLALLGRYGGALLTALVVAAGWSANTLYKVAIDRPRPAPERQLIPEPSPYGYPSGHVAVTLALVIAACLLAYGTARLRLVAAAGAVLVAAQAWARVYLGVHHPTDVVGAVLVVGGVATAVVAGCAPLAARLDRLGRGHAGGGGPPHGS